MDQNLYTLSASKLPYLLPLLLAACATPTSPQVPISEPQVRQMSPTQVIPSNLLPDSIMVQNANNNLDVVWHNARLFLAWRSAPNHFASGQAVMHVASSDSAMREWLHEGSFNLGTDLREPQLLSTPNGLILYMAKLGTNPRAFEPQGSVFMRYRSPMEWSDPTPAFPDNFIPWRIEPTPSGGFEVLGYTGGENVYETDGDPIRIMWLISNDGIEWQPHPDTGESGVVLEGGGSEPYLVQLDDGSIMAVVRNEGGDDSGFGSKICTASADALGDWQCTHDPRKFDSPLLFRSAGHIWLIARRHLTETGHYDLDRSDLPQASQYLLYQGEYWNAPKRCAIWSVNRDSKSVHWITDLPSRGDTCFPSIVSAPQNDGWWLFNYSNDPQGDDLNWNQGQLAPTAVFMHHVVLE